MTKTICCYCPTWRRDDPANKGASHGMCQTCAAKFVASTPKAAA